MIGKLLNFDYLIGNGATKCNIDGELLGDQKGLYIAAHGMLRGEITIITFETST